MLKLYSRESKISTNNVSFFIPQPHSILLNFLFNIKNPDYK